MHELQQERRTNQSILELLGTELQQHAEHRNELLLLFHGSNKLENHVLQVLQVGRVGSHLISLVAANFFFKNLLRELSENRGFLGKDFTPWPAQSDFQQWLPPPSTVRSNAQFASSRIQALL